MTATCDGQRERSFAREQQQAVFAETECVDRDPASGMQRWQVHFDTFAFVARTPPQHLAGRLVVNDDLQVALDSQQACHVAPVEHHAVAAIEGLSDDGRPAIDQHATFANPGLNLTT